MTPVADGEVVTIDDYNDLRTEIITTHSHADSELNHGDLLDGALDGTYLSHKIINKHVQGEATEEWPDDPGGDQGVHGLPPAAYLVGCESPSTVIEWGDGVTDSVFDADDNDRVEQSADISFTNVFDSAPIVFIMPMWVSGGGGQMAIRVGTDDITTTQFTAIVGMPYEYAAENQSSIRFRWFAIGEIAP